MVIMLAFIHFNFVRLIDFDLVLLFLETPVRNNVYAQHTWIGTTRRKNNKNKQRNIIRNAQQHQCRMQQQQQFTMKLKQIDDVLHVIWASAKHNFGHCMNTLFVWKLNHAYNNVSRDQVQIAHKFKHEK